MKKVLIGLAVCLGVILAGTPQPARAGKLFLNFYPGFDYSFQGDLVDGLKEYKEFEESLGDTASTSNFPGGLVGGLEFGVMFDQTFGISLSPEFTMGFGMSATSDDGSTIETLTVNPNAIGGSVNVLAYLVSGQSANTYVKAGFGFYHGFVDFRIADDSPSASWGTFTGETVGGLLEIGEEFDLGGGFSLGIAARGRLATISQLSTNDPQGNAAALDEPFSLVRIDVSGDPFLGLVPTSIVDGSTFKYAALDLSGIQFLINLKASL